MGTNLGRNAPLTKIKTLLRNGAAASTDDPTFSVKKKTQRAVDADSQARSFREAETVEGSGLRRSDTFSSKQLVLLEATGSADNRNGNRRRDDDDFQPSRVFAKNVVGCEEVPAYWPTEKLVVIQLFSLVLSNEIYALETPELVRIFEEARSYIS